MKILVTGGSGFIGSNFIHYLLHKYPSYEVYNFDNLSYAGCEMNHDHIRDHKNYHFIKGDICDPKAVDEVVADKDVIVHFAAESHVDNSIENAMVFVMTNVMGTQNLLDAALRHGKKRFHHISTDEVFGHLALDDEPFHEKSPHRPRSPYSASKAASDHLVMAYYHTHGLPVTISNCSNNYGPYQFPEKLIPLFITNILQGKKVPLYGDGQNIRDWIHVFDHNRAVDLIMHHGQIGHSYCIGGNNELPNIELTKLILNHLGVGEDFIEYVPDRKGHDRRYAVNSSKIQAELNWHPEVDFSQGIKETIEWYKKNKDWWQKIKTGEYMQINKDY